MLFRSAGALQISLGTSPSFTELYVKGKVDKWSEELSLLSSIAQTNPQAAYAGFTHGLMSKWAYLSRKIENIGPLLQPLEDIIRTKFIPALCGGPAPNDTLRELLSLPCRLGGLGLVNPTSRADFEYSASKGVTAPIVQSVLSHEGTYTYETLADQLSATANIKERKRSNLRSTANQLKSSLPPHLQRSMDLSQEKSASN